MGGEDGVCGHKKAVEGILMVMDLLSIWIVEVIT